MTSRIGYFIGMALADVRHFFRGRQVVPCLVDWDAEPSDILTALGVPPERLDEALATYHMLMEDDGDDCCPDYEVDCCIATDTIGEIRETAAKLDSRRRGEV